MFVCVSYGYDECVPPYLSPNPLNLSAFCWLLGNHQALSILQKHYRVITSMPVKFSPPNQLTLSRIERPRKNARRKGEEDTEEKMQSWVGLFCRASTMWKEENCPSQILARCVRHHSVQLLSLHHWAFWGAAGGMGWRMRGLFFARVCSSRSAGMSWQK